MIIGETFAYGHIPKTGGDAVHAWLSQIDGLEVDSVHDIKKHQYFWCRGVTRSTYALSIRRLPFWALSFLQELGTNPAVAREYGISPQDTVRPENAFLLKPDEILLQHQAHGRPVSVWLRMEFLFDDVVRFIDKHIQPVTLLLLRRLLEVPTKGQRSYDHNIEAFFTRDQIAELYARFPVWSAVERKVYGSLYGERQMASANSAEFKRAA